MIPITSGLILATFSDGVLSGRLDGSGPAPSIDGDLVARLVPDASGNALGNLTGRALYGASDFGPAVPGLRGLNRESLWSESGIPSLGSFSLISVMRPIGPVSPVEQWGVWAGGNAAGYVRRTDDRNSGPFRFSDRLGFRVGSLGNTLGGGVFCEPLAAGLFLTADSGAHVVAIRRDVSQSTNNQNLWLDGPARSVSSTVHNETLNGGALHLVGSGQFGGDAPGLSLAACLLYSAALADADLLTLLAFLGSKYPLLAIA
jgi:hypothetical protein